MTRDSEARVRRTTVRRAGFNGELPVASARDIDNRMKLILKQTAPTGWIRNHEYIN